MVRGAVAGLSCLAGAFWVGGSALAQSATRELPGSYVSGGPPVVVTIALTVLPSTVAAGVEDLPPNGWGITNISNGGSIDIQTGKVKWGPFFNPSVPAMISYEAAAPPGAFGNQCFSGTASFDGLEQPITGDQCFIRAAPAITSVGAVLFAAVLIAVGCTILRRASWN